jgi:hypothetical protein
MVTRPKAAVALSATCSSRAQRASLGRMAGRHGQPEYRYAVIRNHSHEPNLWGMASQGQVVGAVFTEVVVEPMTGIEPAYSAWEADVLPLNYIGNVAWRG